MYDIPQRKLFSVLVVVGKKEKDAVKAILQEFNPILRDIYCQTKDGNGQRWLMIDLEDKENMYSDIFRLIDIRRG